MDSEKVGKFIKELRLKNNLTQQEFASEFGVTYQAVSKWETGILLCKWHRNDFSVNTIVYTSFYFKIREFRLLKPICIYKSYICTYILQVRNVSWCTKNHLEIFIYKDYKISWCFLISCYVFQKKNLKNRYKLY